MRLLPLILLFSYSCASLSPEACSIVGPFEAPETVTVSGDGWNGSMLLMILLIEALRIVASMLRIWKGSDKGKLV